MNATAKSHAHAPEEYALFADAVTTYRAVFRRKPQLAQRRLPGGSPALLFSGWLLLFPNGLGHGWTVRTVSTQERFSHLPCLSKPAQAEKKSLSAAMIHLCYLESHRLVHEALG